MHSIVSKICRLIRLSRNAITSLRKCMPHLPSCLHLPEWMRVLQESRRFSERWIKYGMGNYSSVSATLSVLHKRG